MTLNLKKTTCEQHRKYGMVSKVARMFVTSLCLLSSMTVFAQTKTFKVASLNVDGLPPSISVLGQKISLNPDSGEGTAATRISELIANKGWDFFAVEEDFNYHTELMSQISDYYNAGTYRGKVSTSNTTLTGGKLKVKTDGLDLIWKKSMTATDESYVKWNTTNGYTSNGSDELILKGYRYYCVTIANGMSVDVYIHHMDAETDEADNLARESQMTQLANAILASDNHRPILIIGDTNCRYTRDRLEELFFDVINSDPRFEIHDPWVDTQWDGVFPEVGGATLDTWQYGAQKGEVVDKIFYINNSDANGMTLTVNSYLHDMDFSYADGSSISDHYPVVVDFTIEYGNKHVMEGSYYLRNVATGKFLAAGGSWGTHTVLGETGNYVTITGTGNDGSYYLHSTCGYISRDCWMDKQEDARGLFNINYADDGNVLITYRDSGTYALTAYDSNLIDVEKYTAGNTYQEWELVSLDDLTKEIYSASDEDPKNATFFIQGANFGRNDTAADAWSRSSDSGLSINQGGLNVDSFDSNFVMEFYNANIGSVSTTKTSGSMTQTISSLPNGRYRMSVQAFRREYGNNFTISANGAEVDIPVMSDQAQETQLHSGAVQLENGLWVPNDIESAAAFFNAGLYTTSVDFTVTDHTLTLSVNKEHTKSSKWYAFDNFQLTYLGQTVEESAVYQKVKAAMDDASSKAAAMNLNNYDNSTVEERYNNRIISGDGSEEIKMTYVALANAAKSQSQIPADMRYVILNNSFEMGAETFWTVTGGGLVSSTAATWKGDGTYLFTGNGGATISQSTEEMGVIIPNGIYEMTAQVSNGAYLTVNGVSSEQSEAASGELSEVLVRFTVANGKADISVTGKAQFTVDNFVLTRVADASTLSGIDMVTVAILDATERVSAMGSPYNDNWDLSEYMKMLETNSLMGDGTTEFNEIYAKLREVVAQRVRDLGDGTDATDAIINPSFEFGKPWGWNIIYSSDTDVMYNENIYQTEGCDGDYLYNTWWIGTPITQTVSGLPMGHYKMTTKVASDAGATVFVFANDTMLKKSITQDKEYFATVEVEFNLKEGDDLNIKVVGGADDGSYVEDGYWWYKTDDFHLTYVNADMSGIEAVDSENTAAIIATTPVDVYSLNGMVLRRGVAYGTAMNELPAGVYIVRSGSKVMKCTK